MVGWSTESVALVVTGGLLALVVITSLHPRVALTPGSRIVFLAGAAAFVGFALAAEYAIDVTVPPVVLALPVLPISVGAVLIRAAVSEPRGARQVPAATVPARPAVQFPVAPAPFGAQGPGAERLLASSPYATPSELSELAYGHPELRTAIAANPSSPASLLQWLTEQGEPAVLAAISARGRLLG